MCALVVEAIGAGAAGFSTSFAYTHRGMDGKPVPSRFAEPDEVEALFLAAGSTGKGVVLATAGEQCTYADMYEYQPRIGRPFTYPLFALANDRHRPQLELHDEAVARGVQVWPQVTPRPLTMQFTMDSPFSLNVSPMFGALMDADRDARLAAYADPEWRARATADLAEQPMAPRWETCEISESSRFPELEGRRVDDLARERGVGTARRDLRARAGGRPAHPVPHLHRQRRRRTGARASSPTRRSRSGSPTPARTSGSCATRRCRSTSSAGGCATGSSCRSSARCASSPASPPTCSASSTAATCAKAGGPTSPCSTPRRSRPVPIRRVRDFPADGERLTAEEPVGLRHVLVNGTPIRRDEVQLDSSVRPGMRPELG